MHMTWDYDWHLYLRGGVGEGVVGDDLGQRAAVSTPQRASHRIVICYSDKLALT